MNFETINHKDERLEVGEVIKDENGKLAVILGRYASGYRWKYVLCYMDYTLREALCERGKWQVRDKTCPKVQMKKARDKALETNDLNLLSSFALNVLNARQLVKPLTDIKQLEPGKVYVPDIQPATVFGQAGFDFITGGQTA